MNATTNPGASAPIRVDFLYLGLERCGRCRDTEGALDEAVRAVRPVLGLLGRSLEVEKTHVRTAGQAARLGLRSSPTVRVAGRDIAPAEESPCADCCDEAGTAVDCRVWRYRGREYGAAPPAQVAEAILRAALAEAPPADEAEGAHAAPEPPPGPLPENLRRYFAGRARRGRAAARRCC